MSVAEVNEFQFPADPYDMPLENIDPSHAELFERDIIHDYFARLRKEDPVHFVEDSPFGPYWSVTRFKDIMAVDTNHRVFSSQDNIVIGDNTEVFKPKMFIAEDQPRHDVQRKAVTPAVNPQSLADMEGLIRQRICDILDSLPVGETFDWVPNVSIELTTQMLATLFDFPFEDRKLLTLWSDVSASGETVGNSVVTQEERAAILNDCLVYFSRLWHERKGKPGNFDFITLLANDPNTENMIDDPLEYLGNLMLLIVGGNDTTRNSISGGVLALNENPAEYDKLRNAPSLIPNMVSEIIRWQTPLAHMRRNALDNFELNGKKIKKGDKVVMWYISGNRDAEEIPDADKFIIDRPKARHHLSFGFGIHRCMGNRVGEMQVRILWEEIMKRFDFVEVVGEPKRTFSNFVHGLNLFRLNCIRRHKERAR